MSSGKGNNQADVAAAATQTFTQLMIKKKIYSVSRLLRRCN